MHISKEVFFAWWAEVKVLFLKVFRLSRFLVCFKLWICELLFRWFGFSDFQFEIGKSCVSLVPYIFPVRCAQEMRAGSLVKW